MAATRVIITLLVLVLCNSALANNYQRGQISVSGEGTINAKPDECVISFGIHLFHASLDTAHESSQAATQKLVAAIKELGLKDCESNLHSDQVQITTERAIDPRTHQYTHEISGFNVRRGFTYVLHDLSQVEKFVSTIMKNGANQLSSIDFRTSKAQEYRDQARILAARAAKAKAELYAKELGVTVGKPASISESSSRYYGGSANKAMSYAADSASYEGTIPIGQMEISVSVDVVFEINESGAATVAHHAHKEHRDVLFGLQDIDIQTNLKP